MSGPSTHAQLKEWVLRKLGKPVIDINVDDSQLDDRIEDALEFWREYHYDGQTRLYVAHQLTQAEIDQRFIEINDYTIPAITRVFRVSDASASAQDILTSVEYNIRLNELWNFNNQNLIGYVITKQFYEMVQQTTSTEPTVRYRVYEGKLYIDTNWEKYLEGEYIVMELFQYLDPDTFPRIYNDRVFKELAAAYCKKQWGDNLSKFSSVQLPGGITLDGGAIREDAAAEIAKIETDFQNRHEEPPKFFVG